MSAAARRLSGLRNRLGAGFDQECSIETPTRVSNGAGGWTSGDPTVVENVHCQVRFPAANPQTPEGQAAESSLSRVEVRLPIGTEVSVYSRIVVGPSTFEVQGHDIGRSYATDILCACLRVGDGQ